MSTQLGDFYDALLALKEEELCAIAELHQVRPTRLIKRFTSSVEAVQRRTAIDQPFHNSLRRDPGSARGDKGKSTIWFASYLCDERACTVEGEDSLGFRYIDREIFPNRTTAEVGRSSRRSLDLLLANSHDHVPVIAELKIRGDKPAYFALVQGLMHAAEFQSPAQRERLLKHALKDDPKWPVNGPFADVYIIVFEPPPDGTYRGRSFEATKQISEHMMSDAKVTRYIRRIAYLEASLVGEAMMFKKCFAFGVGL